ncbi:MAG: MBOAT family protein, partial [Planctomycetota bacterium]
GGNRLGPARTYLNLWAVFLLCGLWHGAAWTFVLWGAYHGLLLVLERLGLGRLLRALPRAAAVAVTVLLAAGGWVLFKAESVASALDMYRALAGRSGEFAQPTVIHASAHTWATLAVGAVLAFPVIPALRSQLPRGHAGVSVCGAAFTLTLLLAAIIGISGQTHAPFLYFRF